MKIFIRFLCISFVLIVSPVFLRAMELVEDDASVACGAGLPSTIAEKINACNCQLVLQQHQLKRFPLLNPLAFVLRSLFPCLREVLCFCRKVEQLNCELKVKKEIQAVLLQYVDYTQRLIDVKMDVIKMGGDGVGEGEKEHFVFYAGIQGRILGYARQKMEPLPSEVQKQFKLGLTNAQILGKLELLTDLYRDATAEHIMLAQEFVKEELRSVRADLSEFENSASEEFEVRKLLTTLCEKVDDTLAAIDAGNLSVVRSGMDSLVDDLDKMNMLADVTGKKRFEVAESAAEVGAEVSAAKCARHDDED